MNALDRDLSRRALLVGAGALVVSFSLLPSHLRAQEKKGGLPGSLNSTPMLDSWIRIDADGRITVFTGKAELGQGIKTALLQLAAEELGVEPHAITLVTADTSRTPNEGFTAGSHSMQDSGVAIQNASAQVREILIGLASTRLSLPSEQLHAENGVVIAPDGRKLPYGELVSDQALHLQAQPNSRRINPADYRIVGKDFPRIDIPAKVTGGESYVQDMRMPGMVHARIVRPPHYGAFLQDVDAGNVEKMPGVLKVIRDGSFLGVIAEKEYQAIMAMRALAEMANWKGEAGLPAQSDIFDVLQKARSQDHVILDKGIRADTGARTLSASYRRPYQMHASIGPSCAIALFENDAMTVWSPTQGVFPLRSAIAEMLHMPAEQVRCIHVEGSGCYGHNAADDVSGDAALLAHAFPGRPVRVQWMREDEHSWEPYGPAMVTTVQAALDAQGKISDWQYEVWSNTHSTRPPGAGSLLAALYLAQPFVQSEPKPLPLPEGGGDRNAIPLYAFPNARIVHHFLPDMPLRVSAHRALGAYANVFSIESFMNELAAEAKADPVEFRLRHLEDSRGRDVITLAAEKFGWAQAKNLPRGRGRGFAFARYKNLAGYIAIALEAEVDRNSGRVRIVRAVAATDSGQVTNPDGIRNQVEGGIIQSASWTLYEAVRFDRGGVTSRHWGNYPIMRFDDIPDSIEVHVIDRPGEPFLGTGEIAQGPTSAAIANAIADATGARLRELPLTRQRVRAAIGI